MLALHIDTPYHNIKMSIVFLFGLLDTRIHLSPHDKHLVYDSLFVVSFTANIQSWLAYWVDAHNM